MKNIALTIPALFLIVACGADKIDQEHAAGKLVWEANCQVCHMPGLAGAPKMGDKEAWTKRKAKGLEALHQSALNGFNEMPARGGKSELTDEEVISAVNYMVAKSTK